MQRMAVNASEGCEVKKQDRADGGSQRPVVAKFQGRPVLGFSSCKKISESSVDEGQCGWLKQVARTAERCRESLPYHDLC
jgi:hypothetical protein